ncbi:P-loop containing nucleoside triphosphate hydrolase protein [Apiospora arundinis]|uniref:P-loop containing nucleoside triphosphate hydrolase protein n=1 Tax=Apiospora arundinis TaxID=335852 RepID=A0ABR2HM21_9PEZI
MSEVSKNPPVATSALLDGLLANNLDAATKLWQSKLPFQDPTDGKDIEADPTPIHSRVARLSRLWCDETLSVSKSALRLRSKAWDNRAFLNILDFGSSEWSWHAIVKEAEKFVHPDALLQKPHPSGFDTDSDEDTVVDDKHSIKHRPQEKSPVRTDDSLTSRTPEVVEPSRVKSTDSQNNMDKGGGNNSLDLNIIKSLLERIEKLEADNVSLRDIIKQSDSDDPVTKLPNGWKKVHLVGERTFLDEPSWQPEEDGKLTLKGHEPLLDEDAYLKRHPEIAFLVVLDYGWNPKQNSESDQENKGGSSSVAPTKESIRMTTRPMQRAYDCFLDKTRMRETQNRWSPYTVDAPYLFWYFARPEHVGVLSEMSDDQVELIRLLGEYIEESQAGIYDQVTNRLERGLIRTDQLEFLFRPGSILVMLSNGLPRGRLVLDFAEHITIQGDKFKSVEVRTWAIQVDEHFRREDMHCTVSKSLEEEDAREVKITSLEAYPLSFADEHLVLSLEKRAALFWQCRSHRLVQYVQDLHKNEPQRYIIDHKTYKKVHMSGSGIMADPVSIPEILGFDSETGPSGDHCYLFPPETIAYNLERKCWEDIAVDYISEVQWDKKAFDNLVLSDSRTKELIHALITTKLAVEEGQGADLIKGKGNGLIMLLHGGPGTGKTFTAEAVAEIAEKPLYRVTCGDIGTKPQDVERYLESVFYLARTWDSVILLDEADVFLEQRGLSDLDRNALVSVFLRVLEYFEGILVLTSNRVGTFDEAFKSRIQLALHYPNLNVPQRRKIWRTFLNRLRNISVGQIDYDDILDNLDELARRDINGRAIRNAITTARQLAQYRKQVMMFADLEYVIDVASKFDDYIQTEVREGLTDDQIARERGDR